MGVAPPKKRISTTSQENRRSPAPGGGKNLPTLASSRPAIRTHLAQDRLQRVTHGTWPTLANTEVPFATLCGLVKGSQPRNPLPPPPPLSLPSSPSLLQPWGQDGIPFPPSPCPLSPSPLLVSTIHTTAPPAGHAHQPLTPTTQNVAHPHMAGRPPHETKHSPLLVFQRHVPTPK